MNGQVVECALTVRGTGDHIAGYLVAGTICFVAVCLLLAWLVMARNEARVTRGEEQRRHMADRLVELRRELDAIKRAE